MAIFRVMWILIIIIITVMPITSRRRFSKEDLIYYRDRVKRMFEHAYNGYLRHAYPYDELRPITCDGHDTWGGYSLTLVDALDTLAVMGNFSEFRRVAQLLSETLNFDRDINVSVFETNIRVVGGLLSAHLLSRRAGMTLEPGWPCSGPLLHLAEDVARRLLPAFNTSTGMPYGTVNLRHGVPKDETTITCTAGVTTFIVEFGALSRLTGDPVFEKVALRALEAMWAARSGLNLVGNHIDVSTGKWTAVDAGIGAGVDSYFEYLVKGAILFQNSQLMEWFYSYLKPIELYLKREDWYLWANMNKGTVSLPVFQSLEAFWPGMQSLIGDIDKGMKTLHNYHQVWKQYGFTPEFYSIPKSEVHNNREGYPLRPELIESVMYLYRATSDPYLLEVGVDILESIEHSAKTTCGYGTIRDVRKHQVENRMESFFLAETTKYLYLLFDTENFIHNTGGHGTVINTPGGECIIDAGGYVFNTEAHPLDPAAVHCCSSQKKADDALIHHFHDNVDLLSLLGLVEPKHDMFATAKKKRQRHQRRKHEPTPTQRPDAEVTVQLGKTLPAQDVEKPPDSEKEGQAPVEGRVRLPVPSPGKTSAGKFESEVKKLLRDVRMAPGSVEEVVTRILKTLQEPESAGSEVTGSTPERSTSEEASEDHQQQDQDGSGEETPSTDLRRKDAMSKEGKADPESGTTSDAEGSVHSEVSSQTEAAEESEEEEATCKPHERAETERLEAEREEQEEEEEEVAKGGAQEEEVEEEEPEVKTRLLTCPRQPFYMRLSLMGEMFVNRP